MTVLLGLIACLGLAGALGLVERVARDRSWRAIPVRVHVNGTRGKSTVTRMIWSALVEAGVPAVAKTTGTRPRILLPDRREQPVVRRAPPSIREQLWLLRRARREGARAVVVECMAVDPALQWVAEHEMVGATVGVVTNVRVDHLEAMGRTRGEIAHALANTIPRGGVLILGDAPFARLFESRAAPLGTRVVVAAAAPGGKGSAGLGDAERQNEAVALAACRAIGLDEETAVRGIRRAPRDPGAATGGILTVGKRRVAWLDATAANDPESLDLLATAENARPRDLLVFNHRADRPLRLVAFAEGSRTFRAAARLIVTGDRPAWTIARQLARLRLARSGTEFVRFDALGGEVAARLADRHDGFDRLVFAGNTRGFETASFVALLDQPLETEAGAPEERRP